MGKKIRPQHRFSVTKVPEKTVVVEEVEDIKDDGIPVISFMGTKSLHMTCPHCRSQIQTNVKFVPVCLTHLIAAILFLTTCCCCLPYLFKRCKRAEHKCPKCKKLLGTEDFC